MSVDVRPIADAELSGWVDTMRTAFHLPPGVEADVDFRRDVLQQDLTRTLGAVEAGRVVGTYYSFPTALTVPGGGTVPTDAITAVTVLPTHRRQGLLTRLMRADLAAARDRGDVAAALIAAEYPIYGRFGFGPATEQVVYQLHTKAARFVTPAPTGRVELVTSAQLLELAPPLFDQFRVQRPGQLERAPRTWATRLGVQSAPWSDPAPRTALYRAPDGTPQGYLVYRAKVQWDEHPPGATLDLQELIALTAAAYEGLWRFAAEVDLVRELRAEMRPPDEPLPWLLADPRAVLRQVRRSDLLWVRPLDVPALLAARRYQTSGQVVLEVDDPHELSGGRFLLDGGPDGATCTPTTRSADLRLSLFALGAVSLGGASLRGLVAGGHATVERPQVLAAAELLFQWPLAPWCSTFF